MSHQTDKQQRPFLCARALAKSAAAITVKIWGVVSNERAILAIFVDQRYRSAIGPAAASNLAGPALFILRRRRSPAAAESLEQSGHRRPTLLLGIDAIELGLQKLAFGIQNV